MEESDPNSSPAMVRAVQISERFPLLGQRPWVGAWDGGKVQGVSQRGLGQRAAGALLTLFHVEHVHGPEELGLPVEPTLPQAPQAVEAVIQGHKAGEGPLAGNVGELGPGASLNVKDLKGIDCILGLSSPWGPERGWRGGRGGATVST